MTHPHHSNQKTPFIMAIRSTAFVILLLFFYPATTSPVASGQSVPPEELQALLDFVGGLLAEPGWAEIHPLPCTETPWPGIQCETSTGETDYLHVISIHVGPDVASFPPCKSSAYLSPDALLRLPFLKTLSLFNCFLSPSSISLPNSLFTNSSSLEQLVLDSNTGLSGEIPSTISNVKRLRVLCLSQNAFHGVIPQELGRLQSLQELDLSYNRLHGETPEEIGGLLRLGILDLSFNELHGKLPASIGSLHYLQKLDLSFNYLSGRIPPELGELEGLVLLDLSHNNLTGPLPNALSGLKELVYILMENNPVNTTIPTFLSGLNKLQVIGFSRCGLLGPIPSFFAHLVSLSSLSLDRNKLNGTVPASLESLPKLGQLNLSQNRFSGKIAFSEQFVWRLGRRLDMRDNSGLCSTFNSTFQEASFNLEAPPCLGSVGNNGRNGNGSSGGNGGVFEAGDLRRKPLLHDGGEASFLRHPSFQGFTILISAMLVW